MTAQAILEKLHLDRNQTVIDAACGTGIVTEELLRLHSPTVIGIDIAEDALAKYKSRFANCDKITAIRGNLEAIDTFVDNPVDGIILSSALWNFRWQDFFPRARSVLRERGYVAWNIPAAYLGEGCGFLYDIAQAFSKEPTAKRKLFSMNERELQEVLRSSLAGQVEKYAYRFAMTPDSLRNLFRVFRLRAPFVSFDDSVPLDERQRTSDKVLKSLLEQWSQTGHEEVGYVYVARKNR